MAERIAVYLTAAELRRKMWTGTMNGTTTGFGDGVYKVPGGSGGGQPADVNLTQLSDLDLIADRLPYANGTATLALTPFTSVARQLLDDPDFATMRATLGLALGSQAQAYHANLAALAGLTGANNKGFYFTGAGALSLFDLSIVGRAVVGAATVLAQQQALDLEPGVDVLAFAAKTKAISDLTWAADKGLLFTSSSAVSTFDLTTFVRTLLDDANAAAFLTTLGVSANAQTLLGHTFSQMRTDLGLVISTDVQAHDGDLDTIAGLSPTNDDILQRKAGAWANRSIAQLKTDLNYGTAASVNTGTASGDVALLSTGGLLPVARMASGTPDGTKFVADDGTLKVPTAQGRELGYAETSSSHTSTNTGAYTADLISLLSVTVVGTGRPVEIRFACPGIRNSVVTNWTGVSIIIDGVNWSAFTFWSPSTTVGTGGEVSMRKVLTNAVSYTFEVGIKVAGGTSTLAAISGNTMYLTVVER